MYKHNIIKQNILIVCFATLLIGCGGGSITSTSTEKSIHEGQVKNTVTGQGLENVEVSIGSHTTITDSEGYYTLSELTENKEVVVNFKKDGYLSGSTKIEIKTLSGDNTTSTNYLEYALNTYDTKWNYHSQNGYTGDVMEVPVDTIYTDEHGNIYNGIVYCSWMFKDTMNTKGRDAFPGVFEGRNGNGIVVPFISYGLISIDLKDENGGTLSLSENITLALPSVTGTTANTIPLWYYNYDQGLWIEQGYAERQPDGTYVGDISHPGTWSLNQAIEEEVAIYRGHIVNSDGLPISDVRVYASGENWISSDLSTDESGLFELEVIPSKSFQLTAYNYKDKYSAHYNGTIEAISSGDIVDY